MTRTSLLDSLLPPCDVIVDRVRDRPVSFQKRRGIMVHYDDSSSDTGALSWFRSPDFKLSYNRAYLDDGRRVRITRSIHDKADHAGPCLVEPGVPTYTIPGTTFKYGGANEAYFGFAATADGNDAITEPQFDAMAADCAVIYRLAAWSLDELESRIVGHDAKAIFNPRSNPGHPKLWGKLGRKIDPTGVDKHRPVIDLARLREGIRWYLTDLTLPVWERWAA